MVAERFGKNLAYLRKGAASATATLMAMAKRSKKPADLNRLAAAIVGDATDEMSPKQETSETRAGRVGGRKGGKRRAERMTAEQRSEAARRAANARWESHRRSGFGNK